MNYDNAKLPTAEQFARLDQGDERPVVYLNLLKYREKAVYADGRPTDLSGRDAYRIYGMMVIPLVTATGGRFLYTGRLTETLIGRVEGLWDEMALVLYPSRAASLAMFRSEAYAAITPHRDAGLEGQLLIETRPDFMPG